MKTPTTTTSIAQLEQQFSLLISARRQITDSHELAWFFVSLDEFFNQLSKAIQALIRKNDHAGVTSLVKFRRTCCDTLSSIDHFYEQFLYSITTKNQN